MSGERKVGRGLIIAIEDYPDAVGLAKKLPGTTRAGDDFRNWLINVKKVPAENILDCAADGTPGQTGGTKREQIIREAIRLVQLGRDGTNELYLFFSGHGFSYRMTRDSRPIDVVAGSDVTDLTVSTTGCIAMPELQ